MQAALAKGDDRPKKDCLSIASRLDPTRVLELLETHPMQNPGMESGIRKMAATEILATDALGAESIVRAIPNAKDREWAFVELASAVPDDKRSVKRKFLELATTEAHVPPFAPRGAEARRVELGRLARAWLDFGDVEQARPLVRDGLETLTVLPKIQQYDDGFLATAARIEPDRVLSLIRNVSSTADRQAYYARIAESLAIEHPAEAERVFQLTDDSPRTAMQVRSRIALQLGLCRRLAKSDPPRARRIISGMQTPRDQALGWALLALGLADRNKLAASTALTESIQAIDRLPDSAKDVKPAATRVLADHNPAALILPIVEKVAPERLEEVFWRAVALMPNDDQSQNRGFVDFRLADATVVLARYDRQVTDVFVRQAMSALPAGRAVYNPMMIRAKAGVDPQSAVRLFESLPPGGRDERPSPNSMMYFSPRRVAHLPDRIGRSSLAVRLDPRRCRLRRTELPLRISEPGHSTWIAKVDNNQMHAAISCDRLRGGRRCYSRAALALGNAPGDDFFENRVRPVLAGVCLRCHGPQKQSGGLRVDTRESLAQGGDSGPAIDATNLDQSLILDAIRRVEGVSAMPPDKPLVPQQVADLAAWVSSGAPWPKQKARIDALTHWAFQSARDLRPPAVRDERWVQTSIDRFILARLESLGQKPAPAADRPTLLRRMTFDLTGLPPTYAEVIAFERDRSPDAVERVLDRLLASPQYGEHWGRHWLDVVRYADTAGETADIPVPAAWHYRNYVIDAFNADLPYTEFLREQIAGDILAEKEPRTRYAERVTATGYLAISRRFGFDSENYHHLTIQDTIDTLGQGVLGLSLGCARCHDHKFDPVSMNDYYALYGIFDSSRYAFPGSEQKQQTRALVPLVASGESRVRWREFDAQVKALRAALEKHERPIPTAVLRSLHDVDGDFELQAPAAGGSNGVLVPPWLYEGTIAVTSEAQSPFGNLYSRGKVGVSVPEGSAALSHRASDLSRAHPRDMQTAAREP